MSPKAEPTPEEIEAEARERAEVDATFRGKAARATYEAAMRRSGLSAKTIEGKWADLAPKLRVQWLAGVDMVLWAVAERGGGRAAARCLADDLVPMTPEARGQIAAFLALFGPDGEAPR